MRILSTTTLTHFNSVIHSRSVIHRKEDGPDGAWIMHGYRRPISDRQLERTSTQARLQHHRPTDRLTDGPTEHSPRCVCLAECVCVCVCAAKEPPSGLMGRSVCLSVCLRELGKDNLIRTDPLTPSVCARACVCVCVSLSLSLGRT